MYTAIYSNSFKRDLKVAKKRGEDLQLLRAVMDKLITGIPLEANYRDHALTGNWKGFRECHVKGDWLLVYYYYDGDTIVFSRLGSHSDLRF